MIFCEFDVVIYIYVGFEIGVVLIKGFFIQVVVCYLLGFYLVQVCGMKYGDEICGVMFEFDQMFGKIQEVFDEIELVYELVCVMVKEEEVVFFFGCYVGYLVVFEGVFKFKEIVYMYVEGFVVGEFKYGFIVVIEEGILVFVVVLLKG